MQVDKHPVPDNELRQHSAMIPTGRQAQGRLEWGGPLALNEAP